jgi:hypothetical protein
MDAAQRAGAAMARVRHDMKHWLTHASGQSTSQLARLLGTTPATVARLVGSVPTRPADFRRLARKLGVDYESLLVVLKDMAVAGGRRRPKARKRA